jgi:hypothetical protein
VLAPLANSLLANFRTIRLQAVVLPTRPDLQPTEWWAMAKARYAEKWVLYDLRDRLRRVLIQHRHCYKVVLRSCSDLPAAALYQSSRNPLIEPKQLRPTVRGGEPESVKFST